MRFVLAPMFLAGTLAVPLAAQRPVTPTTVRVVGDSTVGHRPPPLNYFFRSLLIPGWGQSSLDRKLTGALFIGFEGLAISMTLKTTYELRYLDQVDSVTARSRRGERQDWIVLLAFNHLFSGLEAYVSAHLLDFPRDLRVRALPLPGGRNGVGFSIGMPH
jgi:hypothetical protein